MLHAKFTWKCQMIDPYPNHCYCSNPASSFRIHYPQYPYILCTFTLFSPQHTRASSFFVCFIQSTAYDLFSESDTYQIYSGRYIKLPLSATLKWVIINKTMWQLVSTKPCSLEPYILVVPLSSGSRDQTTECVTWYSFNRLSRAIN